MNNNCDAGENEYSNFLELHKPQLEASSIPERHWKTLCAKLKNEVFDAGLAFSIAQIEEANDGESDSSGKQNMNCSWQVIVSREDGIDPADPKHVYLIDHAWTYQLRHAKKQLQQIPNLLERMASLMDVSDNLCHDKQRLLEMVLSRMWRYNQTYHIANLSTENDDGLEPMWYIMDEFGSKIQHSHEPTVKTVPFFYVPAKISFTLLWPITKLEEGDEVTRDFTGGIMDEDLRKARLLPWFENDLTNINWRQEEPDIKYFEMYCQGETLPIILNSSPRLNNSETIKVFTDITQLTTFLTDTRFEFTKDEEKADIIWCKKVFKDFRSLSEHHPNCFVNQFPNEMLLTVKDALAVVARRVVNSNIGSKSNPALETEPIWLPTTFNLVTELPKFVSYFQQREIESLDNHWILKPWNMARAVDTHICADIDTIVRLAESIPKVACKYIERPVLFLREEIGWVKFDIRYIVLLSSTSPLKLYAYRVFWLRFANKEYSLTNLDDYETHFTVMNYKDGAQLKQIHYDEFIPMFEKQYPNFKWPDVEKKIFTMFKELFGAACSKPPPSGIPVSPQSRAMYAIDLMLDWEINPNGEKVMTPKLCEVNYCPDCERACKYHPQFYNDVFRTLFLEDTEGRPVTLL